MDLHPNDDDPAVAAQEPHLPLLNDDITEPWPVPSPQPKKVIDIEPLQPDLTEPSPVPSPPPKEVLIDIIEPEIYSSCPILPFNNNSYSLDDDDIRPEPEPCSIPAAPFNNPPPDQSVSSSALQQWHFCSSLIWTEPSTSNNLDLKGHVMVKVRTTPGDIIKLENNIRIIPQEEAVCSFCFHMLFPVNNDHNNNNDNVLETKCLCPFTLAHEHCATESSGKKGNTKCNVCDQDTNYIPVTLSTPPLTSEEKPDKGSSSSTLKKWSCFRTD